MREPVKFTVHILSSQLMNKFVDIVFPGNGSVKDLSRLLSKLRYSLTHILWLTNSEAGEYRLRPVPLTVFDAWSKSHSEYPHSLQFENQAAVVTVMLPPHGRSARIIAQHIILNVHAMCQPKDARVWSGTGRTAQAQSPHLALKFLTISHNTFKWRSQEWGRSSLFTSIRQRDKQTRHRNRSPLLRFQTKITKRHRVVAQQQRV